jgi:hypothetical protein
MLTVEYEAHMCISQIRHVLSNDQGADDKPQGMNPTCSIKNQASDRCKCWKLQGDLKDISTWNEVPLCSKKVFRWWLRPLTAISAETI